MAPPCTGDAWKTQSHDLLPGIFTLCITEIPTLVVTEQQCSVAQRSEDRPRCLPNEVGGDIQAPQAAPEAAKVAQVDTRGSGRMEVEVAY
jgi:hypothetical protein